MYHKEQISVRFEPKYNTFHSRKSNQNWHQHNGCYFCGRHVLTHWDWVTHKCVNKLTSIDSDNGLSPGRRQAIIWTNAEILLIGPFGTNFSEILIGIQTFSFKKVHLKMSSAKCRPFCLSLTDNDYWHVPSLISPLTCCTTPGIILCLHPANERQYYNVTLSLIGWGACT